MDTQGVSGSNTPLDYPTHFYRVTFYSFPPEIQRGHNSCPGSLDSHRESGHALLGRELENVSGTDYIYDNC